MEVSEPERDEQERERMLQVSLRLKAARYLAGGRAESGSKQPGQAVALTAEELADHPLLVENGITLNRIRDIEQMKSSPARPMELEKLADALGVSHDFLLSPVRPPRERLRAEELVDKLQTYTREIEEWLNQQGRDVGRRGLRRRRGQDPPLEDREATG